MATRFPRRGAVLRRRRVCRFCANPNLVLDYKNVRLLNEFVTERAKIIPRRISGNCAKHQRKLTVEIKRARQLGLMPFVSPGL